MNNDIIIIRNGFARRLMAAAAAAALLLCGCKGDPGDGAGSGSAGGRNRLGDKLRVESLEKVAGNISDGWIITLRITNTSRHSPSVTDGKVDVWVNGRRTAGAYLTGRVSIPGRSENVPVDVPVGVTVDNPLQALSLLNAVRSGNYAGIDVSIDAHVEVAGIRRAIAVERIPLQTLLQRLGYAK